MLRNVLASHFAVLVACTASVTSSLANIVANGSFETGTQNATNPTIAVAIPGWTIGGNGVERWDPSATPLGAPGSAYDGAWAIDLAFFTSGNGILSQTLPTTPSTYYELTFALGNSTFFGRDGTGVVDLYIDGNFVNSLNTPTAPSPTIVWDDYALPFQATSPATVIEFRNTQDPDDYFAFLDDVAVVEAETTDYLLKVEYVSPEVTGLLIDGYDPIPQTVQATFALNDVADGQRVIGLDQVFEFDLEIPGDNPTAADLDDFELTLNASGTPQALNWSIQNFGPGVDIANDNFTLEITGTDPETETEFRYFWSESTNTFASLIPGDFDFDSDVDGRDFLVWQRGGSPNPLSSDELELWREQYGTAPLAGVGVPEPASLLLVAALAPMILRRSVAA